MEIDYTDLIKIEPSNLADSKQDLLLTLALIRNDFSDLVYLQKLHKEKSEDFKLEVSAKNGQITGRNIYILRLALSHFYSFLEFLDKRDDLIRNNQKLQLVIDKLDKKDKKLWEDFCFLAKNLFLKKSNKLNNFIVKDDILKLLRLSKYARHNLTFHYSGSFNYLKIGFDEAFYVQPKNSANRVAFATELEDIYKDRSYYIDLSIQTYLERVADLKIDVFKIEKEFVELLAYANRILSRIVSTYHKDLLISEKSH